MKNRLGWQNEYYAISVSPTKRDVVNRYIDKQEEHHRYRTFQEEYDVLFKKYLINEYR